MANRFEEKREWPRQDSAIQVSIRCWCTGNESASWLVGEALNVSPEGMSVRVEPLPDIPITSNITLFCLPQSLSIPEPDDVPDPEPIRIEGEVVRTDQSRNVIGIKIVS